MRLIGQVSQLLAKPAVLAVPGVSRAGQRAAKSHTGAVATQRRVLEGVARQYGVVLVDDTDSLVMSVDALMTIEQRRLPSNGVGLLATSGGAGVLAADAVATRALGLPEPTSDTRHRVELLTGTRGSLNPLDTGAVSLDDPEAFGRLVREYASDPGFGVLVGLWGKGLATAGKEYVGHVRQSETFVRSVQESGKIAVLAAPTRQARALVLDWPGVVLATGSAELGIKLRALCDWSGGDTGVVDDQEPGEGFDAIRVLTGAQSREALQPLPLSWPRTQIVAEVDAEQLAEVLAWGTIIAKTEAPLAHRAVEGGVLPGLADADALGHAVAFLLRRFSWSVALSERFAPSTKRGPRATRRRCRPRSVAPGRCHY